MVTRALARWPGLLAIGAVGLVFVSCGSDDGVASTPTGGTGGAPTGSGVTVSSWSTTGTTTGPGYDDPCEEYGGYHCDDGPSQPSGTCHDPNAATAGPSGMAAMGLDRCTASQITEFYAACVDPAATQATCTAFQGVHPDCHGCLLPVDMNGNADGALPPSFVANGTLVLNVWACQALLAGPPSCAKRLGDWQACALTSCATCTDRGFPPCYDTATSPGGVCFDYVPLPDECEALLSETPPPPCVNSAANPTTEDYVLGVGMVICGPPAP